MVLLTPLLRTAVQVRLTNFILYFYKMKIVVTLPAESMENGVAYLDDAVNNV